MHHEYHYLGGRGLQPPEPPPWIRPCNYNEGIYVYVAKFSMSLKSDDGARVEQQGKHFIETITGQ